MCKAFDEKVAQAKEAVAAVSPQDANTRKENDPEVLFIDPRNLSDIKATTGIIPGALNITLDELNNNTDDKLPQALADRTRSIITACQGGPMGALAAHALQQRGYRNVQFMDGGTQGWLDAGYATH